LVNNVSTWQSITKTIFTRMQLAWAYCYHLGEGLTEMQALCTS